jgi:short-subunit dehydrogenase
MLVTGASGGIGADLARYAATKGHDLALVARNRAALDAIADEIAVLPGRSLPRPLVFDLDLAAPGAPAALAEAMETAGAAPDILVNNAGYGVLGPALAGDAAEQLGMIDLNIRALTELSLIFAPQLVESKGRLLNVASIAAFMPGPGMAVYYASKAYVLSFTQALAVELAPRGVSVSALCPGPVPTGFQARARFTNSMDAMMNRVALSSPAVAKIAYDGLMAGKRVILPGVAAKIVAATTPLSPRALVLAIVSRLQLRRKERERA